MGSVLHLWKLLMVLLRLWLLGVVCRVSVIVRDCAVLLSVVLVTHLVTTLAAVERFYARSHLVLSHIAVVTEVKRRGTHVVLLMALDRHTLGILCPFFQVVFLSLWVHDTL